MLMKATEWLGIGLIAKDGTAGQVEDLYFEDKQWTLQYLLVDCEPWRVRRKMLFPVRLMDTLDWEARKIHLKMTLDQIKAASEVDFSTTLPWQLEKDLYEFFRWPSYWQTSVFHAPAYAKMSPPRNAPVPSDLRPQLHSLREVTGYQVETRDGDIGHLADFMLQEDPKNKTWQIAHFALNLKKAYQEDRQVLLAPHWLKEINAHTSTILLDLHHSDIRSSTDFDFEELEHLKH